MSDEQTSAGNHPPAVYQPQLTPIKITMKRSLILTVFPLLLLSTLASTVSTSSITSPTACFSNVECPSPTFCNATQRCVPRIPKNAPCSNVGLSECVDKLTCKFVDDDSTSPICVPRLPLGEDCRLDATRPCARDLICERNTTTCQPFTDGFTGTPCQFDRHCQQDKGFYCQTEPGVCAPKRRQGGVCDRRADNFECLGFCVSSSFDNGICISGRNEGDLCTETSQCNNPFYENDGPRPDRLICNVPKGVTGRCVRESRLLTRLGAPCNPFQDRCDARRSLVCRPRAGRHVCQHRLSRFDRQFQQFCEPRSRLSRCPTRGERTECRLGRSVPGEAELFGFRPSPFFSCLRKTEKVARGGICSVEYAACKRGTECRVVPGVQPRPPSPFDRFSSPPLPFCVRVVKQGGSCGDVPDKFVKQCDTGLRCEKGTCVKAAEDEPPFDDEITHAGVGAPCADLPCAPGLVCEKEEFGPVKRCAFPLRIVGKGRACTNRAVERRKCAKGLACALQKDGTSVRRCRTPGRAGDFCEAESDCADGLRCPFVWTGNRRQEEQRCYKPETALRLGQKCNPKARRSQPRCVTTELPDESFPQETITRPMGCLPKRDGFTCRVVVGLFGFCDEKGDITCDTGLKCGGLGVCIPVGE